jgi:signal transduction histidine kinase/CheY-like chemotaxis protein
MEMKLIPELPAEFRIEQQLLFSKAINTICEFIITNETSEDLLEYANRIMGETLSTDRALIYDISFEKNRISSLCEWLKVDHPDIEPTLGGYTSLEMFKFSCSEIKETKNYLVSYFDSVNPLFIKEGSGILLHEQLKIKSLIWFPFVFDDHGFYLFTLNQILEKRRWTEEEIGFLGSVARLVSLALVKIRLLEERKHSENVLHDIISQNPVSIQIVDKDGFTLNVNAAHTRLFGAVPPPDFSIFNDNQLFQQGFRELFERVRSGDVVSFPDSYYNVHDVSPEFPDNPVWIRGVVFPLYGKEVTPDRFVFMHENITDRKQTEDALKQALTKAESGNQLKTAFMNNISHEIRTPLNGILGFSELLMQTDLSEEDKEKFYLHLKISSDRLINTISSYIDISLITTGNVEINRKPFKTDPFIHLLGAEFEPLCTVKNLKLLLKIPSKEGSITLNSDPELLHKVFSQLLDNAVKFTSTGKISFGYVVKPGFLEFFVKDTGVGISKGSQKRIFEIFAQEEVSITRGYEGNGLGLSIAQGLVNLLGGEIWVESNKGFGATFFVKIPYIKDDVEMVLPEPKVPKINIQSKPVVLIAEDDESSRFYLEKLLSSGAVSVRSVLNGKEALEQCQVNSDISLVLMDLKMPVMDGFEATRLIRNFRKDLPVIAITAYANSSEKAMAMQAGCDDYLSKPVTKDLLMRRLIKYGIIV